ncbi:MAG TPA: DUF2283 domain-containing protein [Candidatus Eisenbacteria bacterium]
MKITYFRDTDMLSIQLRDVPSTESEEVAPGFVFDFGVDGAVVALEIEHASHHVDIRGVTVQALDVLS